MKSVMGAAIVRHFRDLVDWFAKVRTEAKKSMYLPNRVKPVAKIPGKKRPYHDKHTIEGRPGSKRHISPGFDIRDMSTPARVKYFARMENRKTPKAARNKRMREAAAIAKARENAQA